MKALCGALALALVAALTPAGARADDVADFYAGKQIRLISGSSPGGSTASFERLLARFMGRYIPGNPNVLAESQPGAGTLNAANAIFNVAPRDGLVFGVSHGFVPLMPLFDMPGAKFDARRFNYVGALEGETGLCIGMQRDHVATIDDFRNRELLVGTSGPGTEVITFYNTIRAMLGAKIKIIRGYANSNEINLALERGELQARCGISWTSLKVARPNWARGEVVNLVMQLRLARDPELARVPTLGEYVDDPFNRAALKVLMASVELGWPFYLPPETPPARVAAMRDAFSKAVVDPEFLAEGRQQGLKLETAPGAQIQDMIGRLYDTPDDVLARARALAVERAAK